MTAALMNTHVRDNLNAVHGIESSITPTVSQGGAVTVTTTLAHKTLFGRIMVLDVLLAVTSAGTAANTVDITLPSTSIVNASADSAVGVGMILDASTGTYYEGAAVPVSGSLIRIQSHALPNRLGVSGFTAALASGDKIGLHIVTEGT